MAKETMYHKRLSRIYGDSVPEEAKERVKAGTTRSAKSYAKSEALKKKAEMAKDFHRKNNQNKDHDSIQNN